MQKFQQRQYYHIYNRGNNSEKLFYQERNYEYFLKKYDYYLSDYLDTFAFVLMPNHFHLLVRIGEPHRRGFENRVDVSVSKVISHQFNKLFVSYSKAINKQECRTGALFQPRFKRKQITNNNYLRHLICYIHRNPVHHGFVEDMRDWIYSSYNRLISEKATKLKRKEVLDWFDGRKNYLEFHERIRDLRPIKNFVWD